MQGSILRSSELGDEDAYGMSFIEQQSRLKDDPKRKWEAIQACHGKKPSDVRKIVDRMLTGGGRATDIARDLLKEQSGTVTINIEVDKALDWLIQEYAVKAHFKKKSLFIVKILREWAAGGTGTIRPNLIFLF